MVELLHLGLRRWNKLVWLRLIKILRLGLGLRRNIKGWLRLLGLLRLRFGKSGKIGQSRGSGRGRRRGGIIVSILFLLQSRNLCGRLLLGWLGYSWVGLVWFGCAFEVLGYLHL